MPHANLCSCCANLGRAKAVGNHQQVRRVLQQDGKVTHLLLHVQAMFKLGSHPPTQPPIFSTAVPLQPHDMCYLPTHLCNCQVGAVAVAEETQQELRGDGKPGLGLGRRRCSWRCRRSSAGRHGGSSQLCVSLALGDRRPVLISRCRHHTRCPLACWGCRRAAGCSRHVPVKQDAQAPARLGRLVLGQQRIQLARNAGHDGRVHCVRH